jgi:tetratricopeptide (TPR) repeat protein
MLKSSFKSLSSAVFNQTMIPNFTNCPYRVAIYPAAPYAFHFFKKDDARELANLLTRARQGATGGWVRAAAARQAEAAMRERHYDRAIEVYAKALDVAPWWPEGYFNSAKVHAEQKKFDLAIDAMKKYLQLLPNAKDARAAQDKIYEWEYKLKK